MSLAQQPKDVDSYKCREDEVKILRSLYDRDSGKFLGLKYCVDLITVRDTQMNNFLITAM